MLHHLVPQGNTDFYTLRTLWMHLYEIAGGKHIAAGNNITVANVACAHALIA